MIILTIKNDPNVTFPCVLSKIIMNMYTYVCVYIFAFVKMKFI